MKLQRTSDPIAYAEAAYEAATSNGAPSPVIPFSDAPDEEVPWVEGDDYSRTITLSTGLVVTFRDPTGADLKFVEGLAGGNIDKTMRLACRLCTKWGDHAGVTPPQMDKVRAKDMMLISRVIESFLA